MRVFRLLAATGVILTTAVILAATQPDAKKSSPAPAPKKADSTAVASTNKINWLAYDKGVAEAKKTNKHMFVDFTATWCGWCKKMEKETFSQPEVISMLNKNFVPVRVWGDLDNQLSIDGYKITEKEFANSRGVQGYPTFVFETPSREPITGFSGYRDAATLMNYLNQVKKYVDTVGTGSAKATPGK
ncbi:hypothetical protein C3F09_04105 [candidate division GN15 bacterium]|uniref:Thioredoxin domain-containing protein n=1 Tax=candidate division GN15 bacterium TaxID=2072418 RepID=A0A855X3A4_9BACT|nr:MAG: hypothetical protein C3F09_04105 [candidate division GN15 bacterium]